MAILEELRAHLEDEENETVGTAFGGKNPTAHGSYSIATVRDFILDRAPFTGSSQIERRLAEAFHVLPRKLLGVVISSLIRYSFLIELTNITVGSTKMKTRWLPGQILMPQEGSFEPIKGVFEPGNDPRAATYNECIQILSKTLRLVCDELERDNSLADSLLLLNSLRRVPYEFPLSYRDAKREPVHVASNVAWAMNDDVRWLLAARGLLRVAKGSDAAAIRTIEKTKVEVKVFKTDRALTGKDKTNRAKRWEVLAGDFQHATLEQCWSAERKLTHDLVCFEGFPSDLRTPFVDAKLVEIDAPPTRCPVTLETLSFRHLAKSVLDPKHGVSQYQVGHSYPLKRGGKHDGRNVCWQSANGNRIQGDLSVEETNTLLNKIAARRAAL